MFSSLLNGKCLRPFTLISPLMLCPSVARTTKGVRGLEIKVPRFQVVENIPYGIFIDYPWAPPSKCLGCRENGVHLHNSEKHFPSENCTNQFCFSVNVLQMHAKERCMTLLLEWYDTVLTDLTKGRSKALSKCHRSVHGKVLDET